MKFLTTHLDEVGESYWRHLGHAFGFAVAMILGGLACLIHALFPFFCVKTGSDSIRRLHNNMVVNRGNLSQPGVATAVEVRRAA